jgi:hypothetical protein
MAVGAQHAMGRKTTHAKARLSRSTGAAGTEQAPASARPATSGRRHEPSAGPTHALGMAEAVLAASLGEAVAESLATSLNDSINDSFTELMAGGLAAAFEDALAETVSAAVTKELPGALAAAARTSARGGPVVRPGDTPAPTPARELGAGAAGPPDHAVELAAARAVWDSLPPRRLPALPGLDLAVRRLAASDPERIGGDWYDVTALTAETVMIGIGDVAGHGPGASALTAELCHAARAYTLLELRPAHLVSALADLLLAGGQPALASGIAAQLDLPTGRLTWCNAGHPPPVLITPDGGVSFLGDVHGPLLGGAVRTSAGKGGPGGRAGADYPQSAVTLPVGSTVLFYTAGLVDRAGTSLATRLEALAAAAATPFAPRPDDAAGAGARSSGVTAPPLPVACESLLTELAGAAADRRDADACLLAARLG